MGLKAWMAPMNKSSLCILPTRKGESFYLLTYDDIVCRVGVVVNSRLNVISNILNCELWSSVYKMLFKSNGSIDIRPTISSMKLSQLSNTNMIDRYIWLPLVINEKQNQPRGWLDYRETGLAAFFGYCSVERSKQTCYRVTEKLNCLRII